MFKDYDCWIPFHWVYKHDWTILNNCYGKRDRYRKLKLK